VIQFGISGHTPVEGAFASRGSTSPSVVAISAGLADVASVVTQRRTRAAHGALLATGVKGGAGD